MKKFFKWLGHQIFRFLYWFVGFKKIEDEIRAEKEKERLEQEKWLKGRRVRWNRTLNMVAKSVREHFGEDVAV